MKCDFSVPLLLSRRRFAVGDRVSSTKSFWVIPCLFFSSPERRAIRTVSSMLIVISCKSSQPESSVNLIFFWIVQYIQDSCTTNNNRKNNNNTEQTQQLEIFWNENLSNIPFFGSEWGKYDHWELFDFIICLIILQKYICMISIIAQESKQFITVHFFE